jgi:hypothetical protein
MSIATLPHNAPSRPRSEGGIAFELTSDYAPAGDQPQAIAELVAGLREGERDQVLLGVTGSGKTFTVAQIIQETQRPALVLAPNKTLAAQLYGEMRGFFPNNAVEYFVSYYDYYQPEAYVPRSDTYIEKESSRNEQIDDPAGRGRTYRPRRAAGRPRGTAVPAQRYQLHPRHLPGARRRHRNLPGALRGPRLAGLAVRRRDRGDPRIRPADRR